MSDHDAPPTDPDEIDFTDDENVVEIGESRYVVGTSGRPDVEGHEPGSEVDPTADPVSDPAPASDAGSAVNPSTGPRPGAGAAGRPANGGNGGDADRQAVSRWLARSFDGDGFDYGVDVTVHADGSTARNRTASNDVAAAFDTVLSAFVANAGPESPPPEALGLLLAAADSPIDLPPVAIKRFAASQGLTANDSIADLVRAAENAGGLRIE